MTQVATHDFTEMDNAKISKEHWKIMFISGMGFFTENSWMALGSAYSHYLWP